MQASEMRALRSFHLGRKLYRHSSQNPNPPPICRRTLKFPRFSHEFHSTTHCRFLSSAAANESTASSWPDFPDSPMPGESPSSQTPAESPSPQTPAVHTVYDPVSGRLVTKSGEGPGAKPVVDEDETDSSAQVGNRVYGDVMERSGDGRGFKKWGRASKSVYVCQNCGYSDGQWWGMCRQCGECASMKQVTVEDTGGRRVSRATKVSENVRRSWLAKETSSQAPIKSTDVAAQVDELKWRIPLPGQFGAEVERVLGGGLVPASLVLVGGDPGVGKSTLLLQVAALIAKGNVGDTPSRVLYVSGEESVEQIGNRADRLSIESDDLFLHASTDLEDILEQAKRLSPKALIVDSIQTVYLCGVTGSAGGVTQVKECTSTLLRFAKSSGVPVLLTGHVTKSGDIAGPRVLEHIVDVVLFMEGDKCSSHRLLRSMKNRFGSTDELGIFKMSQSGLQGVADPSEIFLSEQHPDSDYLAGVAMTVIMDGTRAFLIEIQALCISGSSGFRQANGISNSRADMLISVVMKQAGLKLQENGIFLNVVGGVSLSETSGDLAIVAAICSSFLDSPIPKGIAFIAEVGLGGELRAVPQMEKRASTLAKLGYKKCIVPKSVETPLLDFNIEGIEILGCNNLKDMIYTVFATS